jgi:hypothetical protein
MVLLKIGSLSLGVVGSEVEFAIYGEGRVDNGGVFEVEHSRYELMATRFETTLFAPKQRAGPLRLVPKEPFLAM